MTTSTAPTIELKPYTKKELVGDMPTWCPGCGDFSILATYFKLLEKRQIPREKITSIAGIGCSSRFPYFVNAYGVHFLHGRAVAFASGVSLSRPDLHVCVFTGDGDAYSIGGNHLTHAARKNIRMTLIVMDNQVYGLTKKQTSPTSPIGFKSKTDTTGAIDHPINPMKQLIAAGATFVARSHSHLPNHVAEVMDQAISHDGFSVVEVLSECTEFFPGAFDTANPRKGGKFELVPKTHDVTDEAAAYKLAMADFPGYFGVFMKVNRATKNALEANLIKETQAKIGIATPQDLLQKSFDRFA